MTRPRLQPAVYPNSLQNSVPSTFIPAKKIGWTWKEIILGNLPSVTIFWPPTGVKGKLSVSSGFSTAGLDLNFCVRSTSLRVCKLFKPLWCPEAAHRTNLSDFLHDHGGQPDPCDVLHQRRGHLVQLHQHEVTQHGQVRHVRQLATTLYGMMSKRRNKMVQLFKPNPYYQVIQHGVCVNVHAWVSACVCARACFQMCVYWGRLRLVL